MLTRNSGNFIAGRYTEDSILLNDSNQNEIKISHKNNYSEYNSIINSIRIFIMRSLKKTKNPIKKTNMLIKNFDMNYKFKETRNFASFFNIETERLIHTSSKNKCIYFIKDNILDIKLNKKKYIKYLDKLLCSPSISIKFLRSFQNDISSIQRLKLNDFLKKNF